jgi:hypothetical protein
MKRDGNVITVVSGKEFTLYGMLEQVDDNSIHVFVDGGMVILLHAIEQGFNNVNEMISFLS